MASPTDPAALAALPIAVEAAPNMAPVPVTAAQARKMVATAQTAAPCSSDAMGRGTPASRAATNPPMPSAISCVTTT